MSIRHSSQKRGSVTVYFIQAGESGPIKIGISRYDLRRRLRTLQCGNSETLHLRGTITGRGDIERSIHQLFAPLRIRGEWFQPAEELLAYIALRSVLPGTASGTIHFLVRQKSRYRAFRKKSLRKVCPMTRAAGSAQACKSSRGRPPASSVADERERHIRCARLYYGTDWTVAEITRLLDIDAKTMYRWIRWAFTYNDDDMVEVERFARCSKRRFRP